MDPMAQSVERSPSTRGAWVRTPLGSLLVHVLNCANVTYAVNMRRFYSLCRSTAERSTYTRWLHGSIPSHGDMFYNDDKLMTRAINFSTFTTDIWGSDEAQCEQSLSC